MSMSAASVGSRGRRTAGAQLADFAGKVKRIHEATTRRYEKLDEAFEQIIGAGCEVLEMPIGLIGQVSNDVFTIVAARPSQDPARPGLNYPLAETLSSEAFRAATTVACTDVASRPEFHDRPSHRDRGRRAFLATPIWVEGQLYGTLTFTSTERRSKPFDQQEIDLIEMLARSLGDKISANVIERRLVAAKLEAEAARDAKEMFLANMGHELRTPLNAIIGFSEIIKDQVLGADLDRYRTYAADINECGRHLLTLINDILDMSKIHLGKYDLQRAPFDLKRLVGECLQVMTTRAEASFIDLSEEVPEGLPPVDADRRAIRQVLLNLLSNGIKFSEPGDRVRIVASRSGDRLRIGVQDTGNGIAAADLARIGHPFEQADSGLSRRHEGAGLGLALCRGLIELHGSRMRIESQVGNGTSVAFDLPLAGGNHAR